MEPIANIAAETAERHSTFQELADLFTELAKSNPGGRVMSDVNCTDWAVLCGLSAVDSQGDVMMRFRSFETHEPVVITEITRAAHG